MKIGIGLPNQVRDVDATIVPGWAAQAEQAGFTGLTTVGRLAYPGVADTVALAAAAATTRSIGLLSAITVAPMWPAELLAKELADIDRLSGERLTAGFGVGVRDDDFPAPGYGIRGRGARHDRDLATYVRIWDGEPVGGGPNPAVPPGSRRVPVLFGGMTAPCYRRMVQWGEGWIGPSVPPAMAGPMFDQARTAWRAGGRDGAPRLVGLCYFGLGDGEAARRDVGDYYAAVPSFAETAVSGVATTPSAVTDAIGAYAELGVDELYFNPGVGDPDEIKRLADVVF